MERRTDLETVYSAWKADILAFELTAHLKNWQDQRESNPHLMVRSHVFYPLDYDPITRHLLACIN